MDFNETVRNLGLSNDSIALECLEAMTHDEILFESGFIQEKEQLTSLYILRLNLAKDLHRKKYRTDEIESWEIATHRLKNSKALKLKLNWVNSSEKKFMLFWDDDSKILEAIYFLYARNSIKEKELHYEQSIEKGYAVSSIKYKAGIEVIPSGICFTDQH